MTGAVLALAMPHVALDARAAAAYAVLGGLAFGASRARPSYGLAALVLADPFEAARYIGPTTITVPKVVLVAVALGLAARGVSFSPLRARPIRAVLGGGIAIALVTLATAIPGVYIDAVARESLKALEYLGVFAVALIAQAQRPGRPAPWAALAFVTVLVCASALVQEGANAPSAVVVLGRTVPRIAGWLDGPNQLAGFLDIAIPLLVARTFERGGRPYGAAVALALGTDLLTFSRAGLFAVVVGIVCVSVRLADRSLLRLRVALPALLGVAAGSGALAATSFVRASLDDVDTASGLGSRAELWRAALQMWRAHPFLGIGAGNFELELPSAGLADVRTHANNLYLQALAEGGVTLFAATVFTLAVAVRTFLFRAPREALFAGAGAATVALALHQCFDFLSFFPKVGSFWWLWLGIASGSLLRDRRVA